MEKCQFYVLIKHYFYVKINVKNRLFFGKEIGKRKLVYEHVWRGKRYTNVMSGLLHEDHLQMRFDCLFKLKRD